MFRISIASQNALLWPRVWAALAWFVAAASVVFWGLKFPSGHGGQSLPLVKSTAPASGASSVQSASSAQSAQHLVRAWGGQTPLPEVSMALSSRFELWGVVAAASGQGSALIAVDGQPPRAFQVGQAVMDGVVLQSLAAKQAQLGPSAQGAALFSLSLPDTDKAP